MSSDHCSKDGGAVSGSARVLTREEADFLTQFLLGSERLVVVGNETSSAEGKDASKGGSQSKRKAV